MPRSISLHLSFPHFLHLKSWPEKSFFSAAPLPSFLCFIFSVWIICSFVSVGSIVLQVLQIRYCLEPFVIMICMFLQVGQNWIVIFIGGDLGFYFYWVNFLKGWYLIVRWKL